MNIQVKDLTGKEQGEMEVPFAVIENGKGTQAVHDVVTAYRAAQRSGTACTKTIGEVAGSGSKPWRQKGTGRARAGLRQSPIWRGGGVVFGPKPRDFSKITSRKTRRLALRKALGERIKMGDVLVVDELKVSAPKTKEIIGLLGKLGLGGTTLFVTDQNDLNFNLAARNIWHVEVVEASLVNTYQILRSDKLVISKSALAKIGERLDGKKS
jgi:large subunit ribosomal protein L4